MIIRLNQEAQQQLEALMLRTGYTSHNHCINVMISSVTNNLRREDEKKAKIKATHI
ncbi:hypothetical protein J2X66_005624 [Pseudomonas sp. 3296]|nr:hypothetical protein [Pseudomonas sp. 3296]